MDNTFQYCLPKKTEVRAGAYMTPSVMDFLTTFTTEDILLTPPYIGKYSAGWYVVYSIREQKYVTIKESIHNKNPDDLIVILSTSQQWIGENIK